MRKENFAVGDYVHVYNRGNRKQLIVRDDRDKWHFLQMLYYLNNKDSVHTPFQDLKEKLKSDFNSRLVWPKEWMPQKPIVHVLAFTLMENHYHLLLREIKEGGISMFMRKIGTSMTNYSNARYKESGRLFQGAYKAKRVGDESYLLDLSAYIHVKNTFELHPKGLAFTKSNFAQAYTWATAYAYSSLGEYAGTHSTPILKKGILGSLLRSPRAYRNFCEEYMESRDDADRAETQNNLEFEE